MEVEWGYRGEEGVGKGKERKGKERVSELVKGYPKALPVRVCPRRMYCIMYCIMYCRMYYWQRIVLWSLFYTNHESFFSFLFISSHLFSSLLFSSLHNASLARL